MTITDEQIEKDKERQKYTLSPPTHTESEMSEWFREITYKHNKLVDKVLERGES